MTTGRVHILGLDIGGAHLKVAGADGDGRLVAVRQIACPLWRGVDRLDAALAAVAGMEEWAGSTDLQAVRVTMTGELADVFPDRETGVAIILERVLAAYGAAAPGRGEAAPRVRVWRGPHGFGDVAAALTRPADVASTNFLATAALTAAALRPADALVIDMGSTTTDIVPLREGRPVPCGLTDADRLATGELVYTGLTRTPVMAVAMMGVYAGRRQGLARDPFATMADVYRLLGTLPDGADHYPPADGRSTSPADSRARLARCFGRDAAVDTGADPDRDIARWRIAAQAIAEVQTGSILDAVFQVLSAEPACGAHIVSAGIGTPVVAEIARRLGARHSTFADVIGLVGPNPGAADRTLATAATWAAPAVAMALLVEAADTR